MSKEKYQRVIENNIVMAIRDSRKDKGIDIDAIADDVSWLIEELEHSTKKEVETSEKLLKAQIENQRYKQALEFYADETKYEQIENYDGETEIYIERDYGEKARKALQGDTNA